MGDWAEPADDGRNSGRRALASAPGAARQRRVVDELADLITDSAAPALVVGAGVDSPAGWAGTVALAERLDCPVWQEPFGSRAGFHRISPLCGPPPWIRRRDARHAGAARPRDRGRHAGRSGSTSSSPGRWSTPARWSRRHRRPGGGAPQPCGSRPAGAPGLRLPCTGGAARAASAPARAAGAPPAASPPAAAASRCAWRMWCLRWPSACPPTPCCSRRRRPAVRS